LPEDIKRWQSVVDLMLEGVDSNGPIFIMVDECAVKSGEMHRRGGLHIDGNWIEKLGSHDSSGHGIIDLKSETLILASNVEGSIAYAGKWEGIVGAGGDCSKVNLGGLKKIRMIGGNIYSGDVSMLHESVPVESDCNRSLIRLNVQH
jgi:hypothetical protein